MPLVWSICDCIQNSDNEPVDDSDAVHAVASSSAELIVMSELSIIQNKLKASKLS